MTWKHLILTAVLALALGLAAGLWFRPEPEVVEVEHVEYRDRVVTKTVVQREEAKTRVVYRERLVTPDGTVRERESEREDTHVAERTDAATEQQTVATEAAERKVTPTARSPPDWRAGVLVGTGLSLDPLGLSAVSYGAHVERRILGPIWAGAWGFQTGQFGLSLSMEW